MSKYQIVSQFKHHGSFARAIGEAWFLADSYNKEIIETAFHYLFHRVEVEGKL